MFMNLEQVELDNEENKPCFRMDFVLTVQTHSS